MKALIVMVIASFLTWQAGAQKIDSAAVAKLSPEKRAKVNGYLQKSKNAKITGLVLCIGGGTLAVVGLAVALNELADDVWFDGVEPETTYTGDILFITGSVAALASIPAFINMNKQKEKARAVLYQEQNVSLAPGVTLPNTRSYGLRIVIPIGK